jgi:serine/threonine-protein kinase
MRFIQGDNLRDAIRRFHDSDVADGGRRFEALAFRELLGRFVAVCQAVAYAHSRGILHRDLKPANVMLGKYGETLVVDWGLAKPVGRADATAAGEATLLPRSGAGSSGTVAGQVLGTAAYMAPEQAAGRLDELGPAADIYSLGATLYELLTGRVAFEAAYLDLILEDVRAGRFPPPRRVQPDVPPALNAICLKAMALKPADRYTTAQELAADIEHWLADEPVTAYREPLSARAWRWVRRHRTPVTGAAALLLTAAVGLAIGVVLVSQERDAKEQARKDAVTARDAEAAARQRTRQALNTLTDDVVERLLAKQVQLGDDERRFLRKVQGFYEEFAAAGGDTPEARAGRADGFLRIGFVRHRLGELAEAEAAYRDAGAVLARLVADYPAAPDYRIALGKNHNGLAVLLHDTGRTQQAEAAYNDALAVLAQLAADFPAAPEYRAGWSDIRFNLGNLLRETGRAQEAETAYRDALAHQGKLVAEFPGVPAYRANLAATHVNLGGLLGATDRPQERETAYRDAVTVYAALVAEFPDVPRYRTNLASSHNHLGHLLQVTGRPQETEAAYREALSILEKLTADFPTVAVYRADLASTLNHLGHLLRETNRPEEAETVQRHALTLCTKLAADSPTVPEYAHELAITLGGLVSLPQYSANHAQLRRWLEQALPYHRAVFQANPRDPKHRRAIWTNLRTLAITLANLGDYTTAIQRAEELAGLAIDPGEDTYFAGCFLAVGIRHATNDPALDETRRRELTESYARRSVERLRQGFVNGFTNHADLLKNHDFDPLRQRPDFIDLLWDLADTPAAK